MKLSAEYEADQRELEEKVKADQQEVDTYEQNKSDFDSFSAIIRKYVGIKELTPAIVNEFPFCYATETARRTGTRKDGTTLMIGAIPPNLKLLASNRNPLIILSISRQVTSHLPSIPSVLINS